MKIKDKEFEVFISEEELGAIVDRLACRISADYAGTNLVVCPVLTGAYLFAADLLRKLTIDAEVAFVKYSSYEGMHSTGKVICQLPFPERVKGRDVLIVEDIVDTGLSMGHLLQEVGKLEPRSVRICTLFYKPEAFKGDYKVDYVGLDIANDFIVGYGLDYDEEGRTLKEVWKTKN
jgi:hypoxanthine phosphoribosyltransferase